LRLGIDLLPFPCLKFTGIVTDSIGVASIKPPAAPFFCFERGAVVGVGEGSMDRLSDDEIDELQDKIDYVLDHCRGDFGTFIESLDAQLEERGWLSEKQIASLDKAYDRQKEWSGE
jgi:hypothetical protein